MKIETIDTGCFYADGGVMFGAIPKTAWSRRYPSDEDNRCVLVMRTLLIRTDCGRVILVDNGAGQKQLHLLSYYRLFDRKDLNEELRQRGVSPAQVTDVVLTHLHFDHCGYTTGRTDNGDISVTYPNARHWVSRAQWENFLNPHALERESYFADNMAAVEANGLLHLISSDTELCDTVGLRLYDGHTPGQIVPYIECQGQTFVFAGDVIPLMAHLSPEWISSNDTCPLISYSEKVRLLEEAVTRRQAIIFCHDAYTRCVTVKKVGETYKKEGDLVVSG